MILNPPEPTLDQIQEIFMPIEGLISLRSIYLLHILDIFLGAISVVQSHTMGKCCKVPEKQKEQECLGHRGVAMFCTSTCMVLTIASYTFSTAVQSGAFICTNFFYLDTTQPMNFLFTHNVFSSNHYLDFSDLF